jgi:hypothetical protein
MKQSKIILLFSALIFGLTGCIKDGDMNIDPSKGTPNVVEFENTGDNVAGATSTYPRFNSDLGVIKDGESVKFNVNVSYSGVEVAPQDISVNVEIDPSALIKFNSENGTNYVVPPTAIFTMPTSLVIKKGERIASMEVTVTSNSSFNFNDNYALPLKISSASLGTISSNFGKAFYSFSARNDYDGIYIMEATAPMVDVVSPGLTGYYPLTMSLITYSGNSIALYDGKGYFSKGFYHPISSGPDVSAYGTFSPVFFFDATGKITSITNYFGQNAGGNKRSAELDPAGVNQATFNADGKVKSFEVSYIMTQSVTTPNSPRTFFHEKFTYSKAR